MGDRAARRAPYHVAANLIAFAATNWDELDGLLLMRGVDLWALPLDRALNVIHAVAMEGRDEKGRAKMWADLDQPTPAQIERGRVDMFWNVEADAAAFAAAQRSLGGMFG